jgi:hypothetical protein
MEMELGLGDALGMSLSEVWAQYFRDSDKGSDRKVRRDLVKEQNYGDVIMNHIQSRRYQTEDMEIDGVLYMSYWEDASF